MINRRDAGKMLLAAAAAMMAGSENANGQDNSATQTQPPAQPPNSGSSVGVNDLIREPLAPMQDSEVTMLTLTLAPGSNSHPHRHTGPVFAYILEGSIENQVDPGEARNYHRGDFFYEPPMHTHRQMRNLSATEPARVLVVEIGEKGKAFTVDAQS